MSQGWIGAKPDAEWWIKEVNKGLQFRKQHAKETEWMKWRRWYRGEWPRGVLPTNIYFKMIRTLVPRVYYRNPSVSITPTLPGLEQLVFAKLLERADNKLLDRMGTKGQMKRAVQLTVQFGTSVPLLGFGAQYAPTPEEWTTEAPTGKSRKIINRVEYNSLVQPNTPWLLTAHPGNIVFPDRCETWEDCRWICQQTRRTPEDLDADPRMKNTANLPSVGTSRSRQTDGSGQQIREGVRIWIIRDKKTQQVFVMAPDGDTDNKVLYQEDDALQIDGGLPAYPLIFNVDDEVIWGVPDSQIIAPQQVEMNEIRTLVMKHRRISLVKMLIELDAIEPDEAGKLVDDDVGGVVKVKNINSVRELTPQPIPAGLLQSEQLVARDVQEILGLGTNQFGEYAPGSADRSATEANIVAMATQIRVDERRDTCADVVTAIVSDLNHTILSHWDEEQVVDVVGPAGVQIWVRFRPTMLRQGKYEVKVDPDTSVPLTKQVREAKATQFYGIAKDNPFVEPQKLTRFWINEVYGGDAEDVLKAPVMNTTQANPMSPQEAVAGLAGLPQQRGNGTAGPPQITL